MIIRSVCYLCHFVINRSVESSPVLRDAKLTSSREAVFSIQEMPVTSIESQQCGIDTYSIYQMMLKGHTFETFKARPMSLDCREACNSDVRCQSYNYLMFKDICELNNRTKEASPEDFVRNNERYYMKKAPNRVPLGSISELPADSCREIKASEGAQTVSGNYWLDSTRSGNSILARCDMDTEKASKRHSTMSEDSGDAVPDTSRKRPRRSESGSQTEDNGSCSGCCNMADIIAEMNRKLDLALARIVEIDEIKKKQKQLENTNADLEKSLQFAHESISKLSERVVAQEKTISELEKGVNELTKSANFEKERAIKLESHSRRNNLIFYGIPEERNENSSKTESTLFSFMENNLKLKEEDIDGISIERAHRLGKQNASDEKPRPIIAKFTFHKNKEIILSNARVLAGTDFGISQDFPREIVEIRRGLVKVLKEAKKKGRDAKLIYDKLYIDGRLYKPSS
ncbi:hypothetical protein ACROYT_G027585 [Oculina patagonica]